MERVVDLVLRLCTSRDARIVSDGDWDGILGTAILVKRLNENGIRVELERIMFPRPQDLPRLTIGSSIVIELPPSRGYKNRGRVCTHRSSL